MKSKYRHRKWEQNTVSLNEKADVIVKGELPCLSAKLTPSIYHQLIRLK